jgi:hypothetical protein
MRDRIINAFVLLALSGFCCSGRAPAVEKRASVEFQDDYVITSVDTGPKHLLRSPSQLALDGNNQLYVLDARESDVKVFDEQGHIKRVIGRMGQGPGELDAPSGLAIIGNELAVSSVTARRLAFFDVRDGRYVRMFIMPDSFSNIRFDSQGSLYAIVTNTLQKTVKFQKYDSNLWIEKTFFSREWFPPDYFQASDWFEVRNDDSIAHSIWPDRCLFFGGTAGSIRAAKTPTAIPPSVSVEPFGGIRRSLPPSLPIERWPGLGGFSMQAGNESQSSRAD